MFTSRGLGDGGTCSLATAVVDAVPAVVVVRGRPLAQEGLGPGRNATEKRMGARSAVATSSLRLQFSSRRTLSPRGGVECEAEDDDGTGDFP